MINRPRGTQDFLDMDLFDYAVNTMRTFLQRASFKHIQTPIIESVDLFKRSLGLHTDVVGKEMFVLQSPTQEVDQISYRGVFLVLALFFVTNGLKKGVTGSFIRSP